MEIHNVYFSILRNPLSIKCYRDLQNYYNQKGIIEEANAFGKLIELRVQKNDTSKHTHFDSKQ